MLKVINKNIIFSFDLDGTLMSHGQNIIDPSGIEALYKAANIGEVVIASARPPRGIFFLFKDLPVKPKAVIALNGAITFLNGKIIESVAMPGDTVEKVMYCCKDRCEVWLYTRSQWFSLNIVSEFCQKEAHSVGFSPRLISKIGDKTTILKMTLLSNDWDNVKMKDLLLNNELSISSSNPGYMEVYSSDANKYRALKKVISHLKVTDPFIFAIGDSDNDIDILSKADFSCTVGNATSKAKAHSRYSSDKHYGKGALDCVTRFIEEFI